MLGRAEFGRGSSGQKTHLRFLDGRRAFDFFLDRLAIFGFSAAANARRFLDAQPGLFAWRPRAIASASPGTLSVIVEPAPIYAPSPMRKGATSTLSLPINTLLP